MQRAVEAGLDALERGDALNMASGMELDCRSGTDRGRLSTRDLLADRYANRIDKPRNDYGGKHGAEHARTEC